MELLYEADCTMISIGGETFGPFAIFAREICLGAGLGWMG